MAEKIAPMTKMRAWLYRRGILHDRGSRSAHLHVVIKEIQAEAAKHAIPGPCAARSQDYLYDEHGLPK